MFRATHPVSGIWVPSNVNEAKQVIKEECDEVLQWQLSKVCATVELVLKEVHAIACYGAGLILRDRTVPPPRYVVAPVEVLAFIDRGSGCCLLSSAVADVIEEIASLFGKERDLAFLSSLTVSFNCGFLLNYVTADFLAGEEVRFRCKLCGTLSDFFGSILKHIILNHSDIVIRWLSLHSNNIEVMKLVAYVLTPVRAYELVLQPVEEPSNAVGLLFPRSSFQRCGWNVLCTVVDPGFKGEIRVVVAPATIFATPLIIEPGARICHMLTLVSEKDFRQYAGQWRRQL